MNADEARSLILRILHRTAPNLTSPTLLPTGPSVTRWTLTPWTS
jgi:hypothetical protein